MVKANRYVPTSGFALLVDGCVKAEFETRDGVDVGAKDLKRRFPMLHIEIYDAQSKSEEVVRS